MAEPVVSPESGAREAKRTPYASPNRPGGRRARRDRRRALRPIEVASPDQLVRRRDLESVVDLLVEDGQRVVRSGSRSRTPAVTSELLAARERISFLEGSLAASAKLERAAQAYADKIEERAAQAREDYQRETGALRTLLDQRERDLRTLALEMGKVQGRLEAAEQKALTGTREAEQAAERARADARAQVDVLANAARRSGFSTGEKLVMLLVALAALTIWALK